MDWNKAEQYLKACESAYLYGYNIGGNLIIPVTIKKLIDENDAATLVEEKVFSDTQITILQLLSDAFMDVFAAVLKNKYTEDTAETRVNIYDIITECIAGEHCFDLITEKFSKDVINSCFTDIEILKAATSIVSLLISSNQYISILSREE
jgi:hydrogenase maturation factor